MGIFARAAAHTVNGVSRAKNHVSDSVRVERLKISDRRAQRAAENAAAEAEELRKRLAETEALAATVTTVEPETEVTVPPLPVS